jgi:hypothetical protein
LMIHLPLRLVPLGVVLLTLCSSWAEGVVTNCTDIALRSALAGGGLVTFSGDCSITVTQTLFITSSNTTILDANGHTVTLNGGGKFRVLSANADLSMIGIRITGGNSTNGGAALFVHPNATVIATNCFFSSNSVAAPNGADGKAGANRTGQGENGQDGTAGGPGYGGAIWNKGTLNLSSCSISNNTVTGGAGGKGGIGGNGTGTLGQGGIGGTGGAGGPTYGGAVYNEGILSLTNCRVTANISLAGNGGAGGAAGSGAFPGRPGRGGAGARADAGGIYNGGDITIVGSTLWANSVQGGNSAAGGTQSNGIGHPGLKGGNSLGGGLYNAWSGMLVNCTFYTNVARAGSGGNGGSGSGTLSTAGPGGDGGDAYGGGFHNTGTLSMQNCTLAKCGAFGGTNGLAGSGIFSAPNGNPGHALGGNLSNTGSRAANLANSLIVWELFGGCGYGAVVDYGNNMTSDRSIALGAQSFPNTANPRLGVLGFYGGPTPTVPLLANSPAIDKIPVQDAPPTDQRGVLRVNEADIGAYEFENALVSISGVIREGTNGLPGVHVSIGTEQTADTGSNGAYTASVLPGTYLVTPSLTNYTFSPASISVTASNAVPNVDFSATPVVGIGTGTNSTVQLSAGGIPGLTYLVQTSTNLMNWQAYSTNVAPVVLTIPIQTNTPASFYRLTR